MTGFEQTLLQEVTALPAARRALSIVVRRYVCGHWSRRSGGPGAGASLTRRRRGAEKTQRECTSLFLCASAPPRQSRWLSQQSLTAPLRQSAAWTAAISRWIGALAGSHGDSVKNQPLSTTRLWKNTQYMHNTCATVRCSQYQSSKLASNVCCIPVFAAVMVSSTRISVPFGAFRTFNMNQTIEQDAVE
jgi:hypothetical protein